jgi:hypothetical protein
MEPEIRKWIIEWIYMEVIDASEDSLVGEKGVLIVVSDTLMYKVSAYVVPAEA